MSDEKLEKLNLSYVVVPNGCQTVANQKSGGKY